MDVIANWMDTARGMTQGISLGDWLTVAVLVMLFLMWVRLNRVTRQAQVARELIQAMTALQTEMNGIRDGLIGLGQDLRESRGAAPASRPEAAQQK